MIIKEESCLISWKCGSEFREEGRGLAAVKRSAFSVLEYYASPGIMTDPGEYADLFGGLTGEISGLVEIVQGLMIHVFWAERYGVKLSEKRQQEVQLRTVSQKIRRILELRDQPLTVGRLLEERLVGNCRDFATFLCAMLRYQRVPARARCGFGVYFLPDHYEDHWVCECWKADEERWVMVDVQLDAFQREKLNIQFDPLDMPPGQFVTGGKAWLMCRAGEADPNKFGIFDMHGIAFIRGNLIRDFLALNKIEILPWDDWGLMESDDKSAATNEVELMDHLAQLTLARNETFPQIRAAYENDSRLHLPSNWEPWP